MPDQPINNPVGYSYSTKDALTSNIGNVSPNTVWLNPIKTAALGAISGLSNPITTSIVQSAGSKLFKTKKLDGILDDRTENLGQPYSLIPFTRKKEMINWPLTFKDSRSFKGYKFSIDNVRLDGASAASRRLFNADTRGSKFSIAYAAASASPGGAYQLFNRETLYGWGNHGSPTALRRDFTSRSNVATRWDAIQNQWKPTRNPIEIATEFLGDKINVIDYSKRKLSDVYQWNPRAIDLASKISGFLDKTDLTKDFIKFYFTGPSLQNGKTDAIDDIMVFRAIIDSFSDTHTPSWTAVNMVGRADPNYMYTGYSREVSLSFTVYATSRDEMKPIYRKLNALSSYTAPEYSSKTIALKAPWLRMTIGDLLVQQPVLINSLSYTFIDSDTTWEINLEDDPTMMQAPHKISVSMGLNVLTDYLPQKNGKMYTLAKQFNEQSQPIAGGDNWLSDFDYADISSRLKELQGAQQQTKLSRKLNATPDPSISGIILPETP